MQPTIESLQVEIQSDSTSAAAGIDALAGSLGKLKSAIKGGLGLSAVAKQLTTINTSLGAISGTNTDNLNKLAQGLQSLSACGKLRLPSSLSTQIVGIGDAVRSITGTDFSVLSELTTALTPLTTVGKSNLNSFISQLQRLPQALQGLSSVNMGAIGTQIKQLVSALTPLSQMGKNNLTSFLTQLQKLPQVMNELRSVNMSTLTLQIRQLANAFAPLATQMQSIANGFSALPARLQRLIASTNQLATSNRGLSSSYVNVAAKIGVAYLSITRIARVLASAITKSTSYVENLNLFTVSMGEFASEAQRYAEQAGEILGIDPSEWMRNQGIFMTITKGFGVASDRAYTMSQNLTQLGYDLSSFANISFADAMQKLQSGIAGELEPLRRIGYDLSVARLQQEALNLGITKSVNAMTQAEKAELRYYAIMTQVTDAQGDMARTLSAPANQIRILQAQVTQCARSLGNIFIPALNAVLPYAIALTKVVRLAADAIANLVGFTLPDIDYGGLTEASGIGDSFEEATEQANAFKNATLGIDELNILGSQDTDSLSDSSLGSLGFELPTLDPIGDAVNERVEEILLKMKEWIGITGEINSWSDLFHTRLGRILTTVGSIGAGLAAWKISQNVLAGVQTLMTLKQSGFGGTIFVTVGLALAVSGITLEASGIKDAIEKELTKMNIAQIISGALETVLGAGVLGKLLSKPISSALAGISGNSAIATSFAAPFAATLFTGGLAAIVTGLPAFILGVWDSIKRGISWLSALLTEFGATLTGLGAGAIGAALGAWGGPVGMAIGALIGLVVGALTNFGIWLYQNWDEIKVWANGVKTDVQEWVSYIETAIKEFPDNVKKIMETFPEKLKEALVKINEWLDSLPDKIKDKFDEWGKSIDDWFDNLWLNIREFDWSSLGEKIGKGVGEMWVFVTKKLPEIKKEIKEWFKELLTEDVPYFFTEFIPEVWATILEWVLSLPGKFDEIKKSIKDGFISIGEHCLDGIIEGISAIGEAWTKWKDGFVQGFKDALGIRSPSTVFEELGTYIVEGLILGIENTLSDSITTVKEWASDTVEWFKKGKDGKGIVENFKEIGGNIIDGFKSKIAMTYTTVSSTITRWAGDVKTWFTSTSFGGVNRESFSTFANNTIEGFKSKIVTSYTNVKTGITRWADDVKTWFTSSSFGGVNRESFSTFANNTIEGFKSKITTSYTNVKASITTWADDVKTWFTSSSFGGVNGSTFLSYASDAINGFKNRISDYHGTVESTMTSFANDVKGWFTGIVSYGSFHSVASDVVEGFKNGIGNLYSTCRDTISGWGSSVISWFKDTLNSSSPSKVFEGIGEDTVLGYNLGVSSLGQTTQNLVNNLADSFTNVNPVMSFGVDTSALKYYNTDSFAKSISSNVTSSSAVAVTGFKEGMEEFYREYIEPTMSQMAEDMRRQAEKSEQTVVQVGNRVVSDAVTTQRKANGYEFAK